MQQKLTKLCCFSVAAASLFSSCAKKKEVQTHGDKAAKLNKSFFDNVGEVKSYLEGAPFAGALERCVYLYENAKGCTIEDLPLIGQGKSIITVDDILERTLTSHKFLADNFSKFLKKYSNEDIMSLFGSVNAIVISDQVKPSFYWGKTGAIYLSGDYFWMLEKELSKLKSKVDERVNYGSKFNFKALKAVAKNGQSIFKNLKKPTRTLEDIKLPLMRLLFHELTHANDYYPKSFYSQISKYDTRAYYDLFKTRLNNYELISDKIPWKLNSEILKGLGKVSFKGKKETSSQLRISANKFIREFKKDAAVAYYSYATSREDFAMLMEQFFMLAHFDVESYTAVLDTSYEKVTKKNIDNFPIKWAVKNRVLNTVILDRASFGLREMIPERAQWRYGRKLGRYSEVELPSGIPFKNVVGY